MPDYVETARLLEIEKRLTDASPWTPEQVSGRLSKSYTGENWRRWVDGFGRIGYSDSDGINMPESTFQLLAYAYENGRDMVYTIRVLALALEKAEAMMGWQGFKEKAKREVDNV